MSRGFIVSLNNLSTSMAKALSHSLIFRIEENFKFWSLCLEVNIVIPCSPKHDYGKIIPALPAENTVDQSVLILGLHLSITNQEIENQCFAEYGISPKEVKRFNKPQSTEKSKTVKRNSVNAD